MMFLFIYRIEGFFVMKDYKIAVAGTGYVGLSIATLLSQYHHVIAVDIMPEKVEMINNRRSPIQDEYIEKYFAEKKLNLTATLDAKARVLFQLGILWAFMKILSVRVLSLVHNFCGNQRHFMIMSTLNFQLSFRRL